MRRSTAGAAAAAFGAATAVTALVIGTATGAAQGGTSEAFGVLAEGLVPLEMVPHVQSSDGSTQSDSLAELPDNDLLSAAVLGIEAGDNVASAELAEVTVVDQIIASAVEVSCEGSDRNTTIVGLEIPGEDFSESFSPEPNTKIVPEQLAGVAQITLNRQTTTDEGGSRVDGIVVDLVDGTQTVIVSSATCAATDGGDDADGGDDSGADGGDDEGPGATAPAPVTTGLPVTG